ncbi:MAG TPA: triple tyrosine motif-containing protein, partial [Candidatus Saccharimonadales bacterium]|nr:triple tyrosine motif-containing protein [Candidatus Saccharimonadales bacterium]
AESTENPADIVNLPLSPGDDPVLRFPPSHHKLDFDYTALNLTASENVHFQYRLEGFDDNWVEGAPDRTASYSRLPRGTYRFEVRACNNNGQWSPVPASVGFVVAPFYWQTWWFRLCVVLVFTMGVIAVMYFVSVRRLRQQLAIMEQQAALQHERARIAKDIHDDLGANLTQIAFLGELAQQDSNEPAKAVERVEKISSTARQAVKSLDEIVWAVNPRNDTLAHLMDYAGQFAVDYLRLAGIRCRLDFPDQCPPRELSTDLRHNLFLAIKEAIHNVVKHAGASEMWLRIKPAETALDIVIEDNGRGFDASNGNGADEALADGLRNMRSRMNEIGGTFEFESFAGAGTKVILHLPLQPLSDAG